MQPYPVNTVERSKTKVGGRLISRAKMRADKRLFCLSKILTDKRTIHKLQLATIFLLRKPDVFCVFVLSLLEQFSIRSCNNNSLIPWTGFVFSNAQSAYLTLWNS